MKALVLKRILKTLVDKFNSLRYSKLLYGQTPMDRINGTCWARYWSILMKMPVCDWQIERGLAVSSQSEVY
jgi:hypothetical protein